MRRDAGHRRCGAGTSWPSSSAAVAILGGMIAAGVFVVAAPPSATAQTIDVPTFQAGSPTFAESLQEIDVAAHDDGGFVVTWGEFGATLGPGNRIVTHRFSRGGVETAPAVRVDTSAFGLYPTITADADGGFIGAWMWSHYNSPRALYVRRLSGAGAGTGGEARVDTPDSGPMVGHAVAYRSTGPVYAYIQNGLWIRAYDRFGTALDASIKIADYASAFHVGAGTLPGDRFVVVWNDAFAGDLTLARMFNADLTPVGPEFTVEAGGVMDAVSTSSEGEIAVVGFAWLDESAPGGARSEVWMRRLAASGTPIGAREVVRSGDSDLRLKSDVDYDSRGNLLVVWREYDAATNTQLPPRARGYGSDGSALGPDFQLSDVPASEIRTEALADDCFANAWYERSRAWANVVCLCAPDAETCGDGSIDATCEACDDGNDVDGDGCDSNCRPSACGNGVVAGGEQCDDGNEDDGDGCDSNCTASACGNGVVAGDEQCDDGNAVSDDGCDANCRPSGCGNGSPNGDEECDDGDGDNGDGCDVNCTVSRCGNGVRGGTEACDDGNAINGDGCDSNCTVSACGNGIVVGEEECDDGGRTSGDGCDAGCLVEDCGNGRVEANEACDPALAPAEGAGACNEDCTLRAVHDSVVLSVRPVEVSIPVGNSPFTSNVVVQVQNADVDPVREVPGHAIRLTAADGDCPPGTVTRQPDFERGADGVQDTAVVDGGNPATAIAEVTVSRDAFTPFDHKIPTRCTLWFAASEATGGSDDPTPDNNLVPVALDVTDTDDPNGAEQDEFFVVSMNPVTVKIAEGQLEVTKQIKPVVRRSRSAPDVDVEVTISASDGDCPPGTVGFVDFNRRVAGIQTRMMLRRGKRAKGSLGLTVNAASFDSPSAESPRRCTALITVTGAGDTDPSNNTTKLVVDVVDRNDF
jgi:cysteine-rich repeat protein